MCISSSRLSLSPCLLLSTLILFVLFTNDLIIKTTLWTLRPACFFLILLFHVFFSPRLFLIIEMLDQVNFNVTTVFCKKNNRFQSDKLKFVMSLRSSEIFSEEFFLEY